MSLERPKRVQRKRTKGWKMPPNTVYVGRPSRFGNIFKVQYDNDKFPGYRGWAVYHPTLGLVRGYYLSPNKAAAAACEEYRAEIISHRRPASRERIKEELAGKNLACWCPLVDKDGKSVPCHADILLELANP